MPLDFVDASFLPWILSGASGEIGWSSSQFAVFAVDILVVIGEAAAAGGGFSSSSAAASSSWTGEGCCGATGPTEPFDDDSSVL